MRRARSVRRVRRPVLIVAPPGDVHGLAVAARIEELGGEAMVWDSARLPATDSLTLRLAKSGRFRAILESGACGEIDLSTLRSIWWRRPAAPTIPGSVRGEYLRAYCRSESDQLFRGTLSALRVPIHNDPDAEDRARKPAQLALATRLGLAIPSTLITSSPAEAAAFCRAAPRGAVFKAFRAPPGSRCATQPFDDRLVDQLALLKHAPAIFQERIPPHRDVRVAVIGSRLFAGVSNSRQLDWRVDAEVTWARHALPSRVARLLVRVLRGLRLTVGHVDLRLLPGGKYVFFEVNPSGQFLFLEIDDAQVEVTRALADLLLDRSV